MTRDTLTLAEEDALITVVLHRFVRHGAGGERYPLRRFPAGIESVKHSSIAPESAIG